MKVPLRLEYRGPSFQRYAAKELGLKLPKPWVAEILGPSATYDLERRFLESHIDYSNANKRLTSGIEFHFILEIGKLYEVQSFIKYGETKRFFATPSEFGIHEISSEKVMIWARELQDYAARFLFEKVTEAAVCQSIT